MKRIRTEYYRKLRSRRIENGKCARCNRPREDLIKTQCVRCRFICSTTSKMSRARKSNDINELMRLRGILDDLYESERESKIEKVEKVEKAEKVEKNNLFKKIRKFFGR